MAFLRFTYLKKNAELNFSLNSITLSCFLCISSFLLSINFISAQSPFTAETGAEVAITVNTGTTIISSDPSFNKQINDSKIATNGIINSYEDDRKSQVIIILKNPEKFKRKPVQSFALSTKKDEKKLSAKVVKTLEKKIVEYKKLVSNNIADNVRNYNGNGLFSADNSSSSFALPSSNHHHDWPKLFILNNDSLRLVLSYFSRFQYSFYNNRSLDYCYSKVFSVRPPPSKLC